MKVGWEPGRRPRPAEGFAGFNNHTIRLNPRVSIGGDRLRVRISNAYGNRPLAIGAATVAWRDKGPVIVPGSDRKLTFGGEEASSSLPARWPSATRSSAEQAARRPRGQRLSAW